MPNEGIYRVELPFKEGEEYSKNEKERVIQTIPAEVVSSFFITSSDENCPTNFAVSSNPT